MVSARERATRARKRKPGETPGKFESKPRAAKPSPGSGGGGGTTPSAPRSIGGGAEVGKKERGGGRTVPPPGSQFLTDPERAGLGLPPLKGPSSAAAPAAPLAQALTPAERIGVGLGPAISPLTPGAPTLANIDFTPININDPIDMEAQEQSGAAAIINGDDLSVIFGGNPLFVGLSKKTAQKGFAVPFGKLTQTTLSGAPAFQVNTKTARLTSKILTRIIAEMKRPRFILPAIGGLIGNYMWSEWSIGEAKEGMIFNMGKAIATNDPAMIAEFQATMAEIFDMTVWENIQRAIPVQSVIFGFGLKAKSLDAQAKVNNRIAQNAIDIPDGPGTPQYWTEVRRQEQEQDKASVDYYNAERKKMLIWEREATKEARNEDARFWAAERAKQRKLEAEDRKAIAEFWIAYRKTMQRMADDSRPSNLNFGGLF